MPKSAEQHRLEGNQHVKHNRLTDALQSYSKAIMTNPDDHISYSNRAKVNIDLGQYENALNDSDCCISKDKTFWKGYHRKATSLMMLNRLDEASQVCSQALEVLGSGEGVDPIKELKTEIDNEKNNPSQREKLTDIAASRIKLKEKINGSKLNAFFKSIADNDCTTLKKLLDQGSDVNQTMNIDLGFTSTVDGLIVALATESKDAFVLLLNSGCTYDKKTDPPFKYNIFHVVCTMGNETFLSCLIDRVEKDCSSSTKEKTRQFLTSTFYATESPCFSPLLITVFVDSVECFELIYNSFLVKTGIIDREKLSKLKIYGKTLLNLLADRGAIKVLRYIIDSDIIKYLDIDGQDENGNTPLHSASSGNRPSTQDMGGHNISTPLVCDHSSETCVHSQIVDILVSELGANLFLQNNENLTPLARSIVYGHFQCTQTLIEVGSLSKNQHFHEMQYTLTGMACLRGHSKCLEVLLDNNVKAANDALHSSILEGHTSCCKILLEREAINDINFAWSFDNSNPKNTPLTLACLLGNLDIVKLLLGYTKQTINVNQVPPNVILPLHMACKTNRHAVVSHLLSIGADPLLIDIEGYSTLSYAASSGDSRLIDIIFQYFEKKSTILAEKVKIMQVVMYKTRKESRTCIEIAASAANLDTFDALLKHCKPYGIMIQDAADIRKQIEEEAKKKQRGNSTLSNPNKEEASLPVGNPSKFQEATAWESLSDVNFQIKMKELLEAVASNMDGRIAEETIHILDGIMINATIMSRLAKTNMDLEWYNLLFVPKTNQESLFTVLTMASNIFIYMDNTKKAKIKTSPQLHTLFGRLLFAKERFNNAKVLSSASYCMRSLYFENFVQAIVKFQGGSLGAVRNNALFLLMNSEEKLQIIGATLFQDIHNILIGKIELVCHHNAKLKSIGGFEIVVTLLTKYLNSGFKLFQGNAAEVLLNILGFAAWDFPKEVMDSGAIQIAAQYIDNLEYIGTKAGEMALSVLFGVLQNVGSNTKKKIEKTYKLYERLKVLLRDEWSRGAQFINYTIRALVFVTNFKACTQTEKELILATTCKAVQHFIPPLTKKFSDDQVALGRHAALILSSGCDNSSSAKVMIDNTVNGLEYYVAICNRAPVRLQSNLVSLIAILMAHSDFMNNLESQKSMEFVTFLQFVSIQSRGYDPQLQPVCFTLMNVLTSLYSGVVPNMSVEGETEEGAGHAGDVSQLSCIFCANKPCKSRCGECKALYCTRECQLADWNLHKLLCKKKK